MAAAESADTRTVVVAELVAEVTRSADIAPGPGRAAAAQLLEKMIAGPVRVVPHILWAIRPI
eukprot:CAMPEP_0119339128 /NCGR_PEP_ID=MMETSP1333-20130426/97649_1 /TAXON_ID=418940 /ORGANISM="Scyphosphaera apsteinii, Strain RCC1455" /LENGTH=61 /DNA_ID=CAMNT_0007350605 /DNA_START=140 /DNA_END=325 /DNA_ORIENTATION=-